MTTKATLLIVEDEPIVSMDIQKRLQLLDYDAPKTVRSGEEAVNEALAMRPDLILMDIMLEGDMDGIDAAGRIREAYNVPVIYLTAYADTETLQRAKITEPFGYIIKPFEDKELETCIEMALYKHKMDRKLFENESKLATTLKSIGDAVLSTDPQGRIKFLNHRAERFTGLKTEDVLNRPIHEAITLVREEDGTPVRGLLEDLVRQAREDSGRAEEEPRIRQHALLTNGTGQRCVDLTATLIQGGNSDTLGMVLVMRDMTDQRRHEAALKESLDNLRKTLKETVSALAVTAEKRDPYTSGHQNRVAKLSVAIAHELGLQGEELEAIHVASLLHDMGKIYIPAEILAKPARLTDMEMGLMRTHPQVGYDILKHISFPWPVAEMVLQHHERMDGTGYPQGIKGDAIHMGARIIMVADVVEAMSSHRPYRAALGMEKALDEIDRHKGMRYDTRVAEACFNVFRQGDFTFE